MTEVASARPRRQILDLGANDGHFSRLVADHAEVVVAVDSDDLVVDRLYRRLRDERDVTIVPVRMNLADPSPSLGWRVRERPAFVDRVDADLVLALALVHHLAISATVPLAGVVAMLADHATRGTTADVVVEFPTPADPMVRRLLQRKRAGRFAHYRLDAFEEAVAERFDTVRRIELPCGTRHLFHLSARR